MRTLLPAPAAALLAALTTAPAADVVTDGYASELLPQPGGLTRTLSSGDILSYDGATVARYDASGAFVETIFTLPGALFTGCFAVNPSETRALVGESTNGDVFDVDLVSGGGTLLTNLPLNFSAAFESETAAIVSAATCGFGCGNDLVRVELGTGTTTALAFVTGASGQVALAEDGDLFYGDVSGDFSPPPGSATLLRFAASDLTGSPLLDESDASVVLAGLDGISSLAYDAATGRLYVAENFFASGENRLLEVQAAGGASRTLVEGDTFNFLGGLELLPGDGTGVFLGYQPDDNGRLVYGRTDFATFDERRALAPARPTLVLSGPGTGGGAGFVDLDVAGGPGSGFAVLAYAPLANTSPVEVAYLVGGLPLVHTGLDPLATQILPAVLALDGEGTGHTGFSNDGGLMDVFAMQALVVDPSPALVGSTTTDVL